MSCSTATDSTSSSPTEDKTPDTTPPTVTISTNKSLEIDKTGTITFTFSEKVNGFTKNDVRFSIDGFSVNDIIIANFITNNNPKEYSLDIIPKVAGTLAISIPTNAFYDLSGNKNTNSFSNNFSVKDNIPPTLNIYSDILIEEKSAYLSFVFSEKVTNFTPDDIQFLTNEANGVGAAKGNFVTNSLTSYSLEITPETNGILYLIIPANSFEDLSANKNDKHYSSNFTVFDSTTTTHTISFKVNGGSFISPQITNLKVVDNTAIEETQLGGILSYPPTGPKPSQAVTRDIFEWQTNDTKYDFSTLVSSDLTLEAVWSNSCEKVETFHPANRNELQNYVNAAVGADSTTNLNHIDTSAITDMNNLFFFKDSFNGKIGCWNTTKVTNMNGMFQLAYAFNQDISSWNVANVINMREMFYNAYAFNQDIGSWDVGNVTDMRTMFTEAYAFNQDIGSWNVANVNNMRKMFESASVFNQNISSWSVNNVTNHDNMFTGSAMESKTNQHPKFPSNPTENITPTVNISSDTLIKGNPAYLSFIFSEKVTNFTPDDIQFLTNKANGVNAAKGNFVTNSQKNYSLEITPKAIGTLYVSIQTNSFEDLSANQNDKPYSNSFTVLDSSTTTHTISFKLNGGLFISPQITNLKVVDNTAIEETRLGGILSYPPTGPKPSIQAVTRDIFEWRTNDTKYELSTPVSNDLTLEAVWSNSCGKVETLHPASRNQLQNYINAAVANSTTNLNHIDTSAITDMNNLFLFKRSFNGKIDCWNTTKVTNMNGMFQLAYAFNQDISSWNVANVNNMGEMFHNASAFNQDIGSWNVANANNMSSMFYRASAFNQDIGSWNVANVNNMNSMFYNASAFNQDIGSWNVANVNNMNSMFYSAYAFNQDISIWNVANVNNMNSMFNYANSFNQDIGSWNTANVKNMYNMFNGAIAFNQDIGSWNTANVNNMYGMFQNANAFNQDIGSWNVANVSDMSYMFESASVFNQNISSWSVNNVTNHDNMFTGSAMESKTNWHPSFP